MPSNTLSGEPRRGGAKLTFAEPLRPVRVIAKPHGFVPLRTFSCGRGTYSEKYIDKWALETFQGGRREPGRTVLALEDAHGLLLGVSKFRPSRLNDEDEWKATERDPSATAYYVHVVAIDRRYRGQRSSDDSRLGDILLDATLEHIGRACDGSLPRVWALIRPENAAAQALFERRGFKAQHQMPDSEIVYTRPWPRRSLTPGRLIGRLARLRGGGND
ncbi:MAG TPA: GNAT family N-acetyltransferase [Solirubrobacteraceae bacterium]|jgi:ribosomal protein S18 acetylase RimI-like enzyme|nr:GNAT family N-acetyltransferase [Solirubrobacteraceae bacterium]